MFVEERQNLILEDLQENGKVLVKDLSTRFGVTPDLIRKDLAFLESKGKCKKIYGGAILNRLNVHLEDANSRKSVNSKEKQKIAQMAYDLIEPNMTVFLDISTTNIELAKLLVLRPISGITVVTNMLDVIQILSTSQIHSIFIGGEFLQRFHFDLAFLGVVGIDLESKSVMTYMPNDGQTKRIVLKQSKKAYMLADSDKFYQMGNYEYAKVDAFYGILQTIKNNKK